MKHIRTLALCSILLIAALAYAQPVSPEKIDIYTFDPSAATPNNVAEYASLANKAYSKGNYEAAAQYYLAYLQAKPEDGGSWYNLSCCYGLLGRADLAAKYLQIAYKKGYTDIEHIKQDTDFDKVKKEAVFIAAVDSVQVWVDKRAYYQGKLEYFPVSQFQSYRLLLPKSYNSRKSYSLIIGLHGYGDKADKFAALWRYMEKEDVIFAVPEAPYAFPDDEKAHFSWDPFVPRDSDTGKQALEYDAKYIKDLAAHLEKEYKIAQTWLLGFSQGAYLSYILAIKNPEAFDGIVACGGGLVTAYLNERDYKAANKVKVIISHGKQDKVVPYKEGEDARKLLEKKKFNVTWHAFEGAHTVSKDVFPILFEQLKQSSLE